MDYQRKFHKATGMPTSLDSIFFAGPYLLCYCVRSRPHLSVPVANSLSAPFSNQLSFRRSVTTSGHAEISSPKTLCLVSRQNRQRNRLFGGPPIQCYTKKHNEKAEWINNMTRELEGFEEGPKAEIHIDLLKTSQKISKWKTPGHDGIHGFWFKKFTSIHNRQAR